MATAHPTPWPSIRQACLCGRRRGFEECCLPLAVGLRDGVDGHRRPPSPFDQLRASAALLLWGLSARKPPPSRLRSGISRAALSFWGTVLHAGIVTPGTRKLSASATSEVLTPRLPPETGGSSHEPRASYGGGLFERLWSPADAATTTWLLATLPPLVRHDPVLGELAIDWLLWDRPWLDDRPAAATLMCTSFLARSPRGRETVRSLVRSSVGLWKILDVVRPGRAAATLPGRVTTTEPPAVDPGSAHASEGVVPRVEPLDSDPKEEGGLLLQDLLSGRRVLVRTPTPPWRDPERRLLIRVYRFGDWHVAGGEGLLLSPAATVDLLEGLSRLRRAHRAPGWPDPGWRGWVKAWVLPVAARVWLSGSG